MEAKFFVPMLCCLFDGHTHTHTNCRCIQGYTYSVRNSSYCVYIIDASPSHNTNFPCQLVVTKSDVSAVTADLYIHCCHTSVVLVGTRQCPSSQR